MTELLWNPRYSGKWSERITGKKESKGELRIWEEFDKKDQTPNFGGYDRKRQLSEFLIDDWCTSRMYRGVESNETLSVSIVGDCKFGDNEKTMTSQITTSLKRISEKLNIALTHTPERGIFAEFSSVEDAERWMMQWDDKKRGGRMINVGSKFDSLLKKMPIFKMDWNIYQLIRSTAIGEVWFNGEKWMDIIPNSRSSGYFHNMVKEYGI